MNFTGSTKRSSSLVTGSFDWGRNAGKVSWPSVLGAAGDWTYILVKACLGRSGVRCMDGTMLTAFWNPWLLLFLQAVPAVTPVDEESSDGEPDQEAVQR